MKRMDWEELYQKGETRWEKGAPSLPLKEYLARHELRGRGLVPGCGRGHEVALAVEHGLDATGLDIAPTAMKEARMRYPHLAERFVLGSVFDPPAEMRGSFDVVLEHTCMSALPPKLRDGLSTWDRSHAATGRVVDWCVVYQSGFGSRAKKGRPFRLASKI